jgi:hypothetical protein
MKASTSASRNMRRPPIRADFGVFGLLRDFRTNVTLGGVGQIIPTKLAGLDEVAGLNTHGDIEVTAITSTGYSIKALPGHPDFPGKVNFNFTDSGGMSQLTISGSSSASIPFGDLGIYSAIVYSSMWQPFAKSTCVTVSGRMPNSC